MPKKQKQPDPEPPKGFVLTDDYLDKFRQDLLALTDPEKGYTASDIWWFRPKEDGPKK